MTTEDLLGLADRWDTAPDEVDDLIHALAAEVRRLRELTDYWENLWKSDAFLTVRDRAERAECELIGWKESTRRAEARVRELEGVLATWTAGAEANEKEANTRIAALKGALRRITEESSSVEWLKGIARAALAGGEP